MADEIMIPTVHRNGTSQDDLLDQHREAADALREALKKIDAAWPNARDYYPQGEAAYPKARKEWEVRARKVKSVLDDMAKIAWEVSQQ